MEEWDVFQWKISLKFGVDQNKGGVSRIFVFTSLIGHKNLQSIVTKKKIKVTSLFLMYN